MIYTVTFNPALDYVMRMSTLVQGKTNRSVTEELYFGGKGINVSFVLREFGVETTAFGFVAGFTGDALVQALAEQGICTDFIRLQEGMTRINVKLKTDFETEINAGGPPIPAEKIAELLEKLEQIQSGDTLVLAGSVPKSLPADIYEQIMARLQGRGIRIVVDAERDLLRNVLKFRPFLIKPNIHELSDLVGHELTDNDDIVAAAKDLQAQGAVNVLVSRGGDGALLVDEFGTVHTSAAIRGVAVNTVGSGDSMVAGFLAGVAQGYAQALRLGIVAGAATAFLPGLATKEKITELLK